jgi:hypothetical protein
LLLCCTATVSDRESNNNLTLRHHSRTFRRRAWKQSSIPAYDVCHPTSLQNYKSAPSSPYSEVRAPRASIKFSMCSTFEETETWSSTRNQLRYYSSTHDGLKELTDYNILAKAHVLLLHITLLENTQLLHLFELFFKSIDDNSALKLVRSG